MYYLFKIIGEFINIRKYLGAFALDVISSCAFGIKVDSINDPNHPMVVNSERFSNFDTSLNRLLCVGFPKLAKLFKLEFFNVNAINYFDKLTHQIVNERKSIYEQRYKGN